MLKSKNFGRKSLNEIKELLDGMGLHLGMRLDEPTISGLSGMILRKSEIQIELDDCREEEQSDILVNELTCLLFALCLDSSLAKSETGKTFENIEEIFEIFIPHILRRFETYHICKTWNEKAENLFQRTQYEEAVSCCDTILNLDPASTDALYLKGLCLSSLTHHLEAINCYDRILRLDKDNVYACFSKGLAYIHLGAEEEALRCYDEAIAIDSEFVPALIERGNTLLGCGRAEEAINSYDIVLSLEPKHLKALINKGRAFDKLGRYKEALSCYDHALVIDSNNADVWFNKGLTLERKSREETRPPMTPEEKLLSAIFGEGEYVSFEEILECYENVLRSDPHFTEAMFRKSVTLHSMGKDVLALRCFEEALAIDAGDYRVWYAQAVVQDRLFRKNKACISFKKFLGLAPDTMSMESRIEYALKRVDEIEKGEQ
jgi:tetratricopeptide (TPR) repeat protein